MTPATLFHALALPPATHLGKRVFKKLFLERPDVTAADRRALDPVTTVTWPHCEKIRSIA